jgi:hypothetical protein
MTFLKNRILITRARPVFGGRYGAEDKRNQQSFHEEASRHFYIAGDNLALPLLTHYFDT